MNYVLSFIFDPEIKRVLLIQKNRPPALAGNWNGIGGKIEKGEIPEDAANRELLEEAGLECSLKSFMEIHIAGINADDTVGANIYCFHGIAAKFDTYQTKTDELVRPCGIKVLHTLPLDQDAAWLVMMAYANVSGKYARSGKVWFD